LHLQVVEVLYKNWHRGDVQLIERVMAILFRADDQFLLGTCIVFIGLCNLAMIGLNFILFIKIASILNLSFPALIRLAR
jgi:hypothetical protein